MEIIALPVFIAVIVIIFITCQKEEFSMDDEERNYLSRTLSRQPIFLEKESTTSEEIKKDIMKLLEY